MKKRNKVFVELGAILGIFLSVFLVPRSLPLRTFILIAVSTLVVVKMVGGGGGKIDQRLAGDVIAQKATVATFMVGMNDAAYQDFDPVFLTVVDDIVNLLEYAKGFRRMLDVGR